MADGLNGEFVRSPEAFLAAHMLEAGVLRVSPGVIDVDMRLVGSRVGVMDHFSRDPADPPFRAHWLPVSDGQFRIIKLDAQADYFFTETLSGCRIDIAPDGSEPTVAHIHASLLQPGRSFSFANASDHRRFRSTFEDTALGPLRRAPISDPPPVRRLTLAEAHYEALAGTQRAGVTNTAAGDAPSRVKATLIGYRTAAGGWKFLIQAYDGLTREVRHSGSFSFVSATD